MKNKPYFKDENFTLYNDNAAAMIFPRKEYGSVRMVLTSPPYYGLRDYGNAEQIGLERSLDLYVAVLLDLFGDISKGMRRDGTIWINLGDTYIGAPGTYKSSDHGKQGQSSRRAREMIPRQALPNKCLAMIPSRVATALCDEHGFILRNDIIWHKPNAIPSSVSDRFTSSYEHLFMFSLNQKYLFNQQKERMITSDTAPPRGSRGTARPMKGRRKQDMTGNPAYTGFNGRYEAPKDRMRNMRDVWTIPTKPYSGAHFATFPEGLIETPILAATNEGDTVFDPFIGSGTTAAVCARLGRKCIGVELNRKYCEIAVERYNNTIAQSTLV